jgi:hypothetical protein
VDFLSRRGPDVDAVIVRIGLHDAELVLVDGHGRWSRWVYASVEEARDVAAKLDATTHSGEFPEPVRVRMNAYARPPGDFDVAYPEQGRVGAVIPYAENRPRQTGALEAEGSPP